MMGRLFEILEELARREAEQAEAMLDRAEATLTKLKQVRARRMSDAFDAVARQLDQQGGG